MKIPVLLLFPIALSLIIFAVPAPTTQEGLNAPRLTPGNDRKKYPAACMKIRCGRKANGSARILQKGTKFLSEYGSCACDHKMRSTKKIVGYNELKYAPLDVDSVPACPDQRNSRGVSP
ncbi:hypothetical protein B0H13DRAFT_1858433 [Mycena leptocephala]|nr:hypothetical protein B0H13DRAFT_1858433 [Mycena leptocephala]